VAADAVAEVLLLPNALHTRYLLVEQDSCTR
jgi:hypothetical protein